MNKDPLIRNKKFLLKQEIFEEKEDEELKKEIKRETENATDITEKSEQPDIREMFQGVYKEMPWFLKEQLRELLKEIGRYYTYFEFSTSN